MKLEIGKIYQTKFGAKMKCVSHDGSDHLPFKCVELDKAATWFLDEDGSFPSRTYIAVEELPMEAEEEDQEPVPMFDTHEQSEGMER
jgi:hypothetical protein